MKEFKRDIFIKSYEAERGEPLEVFRGDNLGNVLVLRVVDRADGVDSEVLLEGLTAKVVFVKSDDTIVVQEMGTHLVIEDNRIKSTLESNVINVLGKVEMEIKLFKGEALVTSAKMQYKVKKPLWDEETVLESFNEVPVIDRMVADVEGAVVKAQGALDLANGYTDLEALRVSAENTRKGNESGRVDAEGLRVTQEIDRADSETLRKSGESSRGTAESTRVLNEGTRVNNEASRQSNEIKRIAMANTFDDNEGLRVDSETARKNAESARVTEEGKRVTAEELRVTADTNRTTAEGLRVSSFDSYNSRIVSIETNFAGKVDKTSIANNLTETAVGKVLDATQGKILNENKVDKVAGKGLSTNDYTTVEKTKLTNIAVEANKTVIANVLTETVAGKALDATQGKIINDKLGNLSTMATTEKSNLSGAISEVKNEVTQHKLNYATQIDLQINNTIKNGNFIEVAGWVGRGTINVENNIATLTLSSLINESQYAFRTTTLLTKTIIGNKYYTSIEIYPKYNSIVRIEYGGGNGYSQGAIANIWNRRSIILTSTLSNFEMYYLSNISSVGYVIGDTIKFKNFIGVDLTTTFGTGNEPTKEEMDLLINLLGGWFNGTITPTQKQLANWCLKMIRQNRTAIVALGGTII